MMFKIRTINDVALIENKFTSAVIAEVNKFVHIFDEYYNSNNTDGGFIAVVESEADLQELQKYNLDCYNDTYEFADKLHDNKNVSILFLVGTEYAIDVIMPLSIIPPHISV